MIEINLLPEEKRVKVRAAAAAPGKPAVPASENLKKLIYLVPAVIGVLLLAHLYLVFAQMTASMGLSSLERKMQALQPQLKDVKGFKTAYESLSQDGQIMQELAAKSGLWSKKLNRLSLDLPPGIWISDLQASNRQLIVRCSAVSLETDEVELINRFISRIKEDSDFYGAFAGFDLGSVQKRQIGTFEVSDFTVTMELKTK